MGSFRWHEIVHKRVQACAHLELVLVRKPGGLLLER